MIGSFRQSLTPPLLLCKNICQCFLVHGDNMDRGYPAMLLHKLIRAAKAFMKRHLCGAAILEGHPACDRFKRVLCDLESQFLEADLIHIAHDLFPLELLGRAVMSSPDCSA